MTPTEPAPSLIALERLLAGLKTIDAFREPAPASGRRVFSAADSAARRFLRQEARQLGLDIWEDAIGNTFYRWETGNLKASAVALGAPLDIRPGEPSWAGPVGILAALEIVKNLQQSGFHPTAPVDVIGFTSSSPERFGVSCLGSRMLTGMLSAGEAERLHDADGVSFDEWRTRVDYVIADLTTVKAEKSAWRAFLQIGPGPGAAPSLFGTPALTAPMRSLLPEAALLTAPSEKDATLMANLTASLYVGFPVKDFPVEEVLRPVLAATASLIRTLLA